MKRIPHRQEAETRECFVLYICFAQEWSFWKHKIGKMLVLKLILYLRLKHGAAVHGVGRRSPLPLLSFALNFCDQNTQVLISKPSRILVGPPLIQTITHLPSGRVLRGPRTPWRPVSRREKQFHHQRPLVTLNASPVSCLSAVPLGSPLSWAWEEEVEETTEEWRKRGGWQQPSALLRLLV